MEPGGVKCLQVRVHDHGSVAKRFQQHHIGRMADEDLHDRGCDLVKDLDLGDDVKPQLRPGAVDRTCKEHRGLIGGLGRRGSRNERQTAKDQNKQDCC